MHRLRGSRSGFRFSRASCCPFLCRCFLSIVIESLLNFFRQFGKVNLRYSRTAREHNAIRFDSFYRDVFVLRPVGAQAVRLGGSCSDKDIAPARNWSERGGQAATAYRTIKLIPRRRTVCTPISSHNGARWKPSRNDFMRATAAQRIAIGSATARPRQGVPSPCS